MESNLLIQTEDKQENEVADEPASPMAQYLNSKVLSVYILAILEVQVPIDESCVIPQLRNVFLPINPRFSSIMISNEKGVQQWKKVEVNLEDHVNIPRVPEDLSIESYDDYFDEYLTKISAKPLPQDRPLWEIHICNYPTSKATAHLIFNLHHALGDGYSLMGALLSCMQRADNPSLPLTFPSTQSSSTVNDSMGVISCIPRTLSTIIQGVCDFGWSLFKSTCNADDKTPIRSGNAGLGLHQTQISTIRFSLDQIKIIKEKLGMTVNAVLAGIIFLGVRLYMQETGTEFSQTPSTALILLNTRDIGGYISVEEMNKPNSKLWGNQFTFLHVAMPEIIECNNSSLLDFVYEAQKQIKRLKSSPSVYFTAMLLEILRKCGGSEAAAKLVNSTLDYASVAITSMIGPIEQVAIANHPIKGIYFMCCGPPLSLLVTIMSYMQTVTIGLGVEKGFIDSQKLISCIDKAYELMYEAATKSK